MKVEIQGKKIELIWGTRVFIEAQRLIGVDVNTIMKSVMNPEAVTCLIYNAIVLGANKDGVELPFNDLADFIEQYDTLFKPEVYNHIVTDMLESMYQGQHLHDYLSKVYGFYFPDLSENVEAKKKYLSTLEKSSSTSRATVSAKKKSTGARSRTTKPTVSETK